MLIPSGPNFYQDVGKTYKVVIVGESGIGKTTLINCLKSGEFTEGLETTIGVESTTISYDVNGQEYTFNFHDTAGQECYRSLAQYYLKNSDIGLICFDPTKEHWINSVNYWRGVVINNSPYANLIAVATKSDTWINILALSTIIEEVQKECDLDVFVAVSSYSNENINTLKSLLAQACAQTSGQKTESFVIEPKPSRCSCSLI